MKKKQPVGNYKGMFDDEWNNPPAPFNPEFDPAAEARYTRVTASLEADNFYKTHTREECKLEWARRYNEIDKLCEQINLI